MDLYNMMCQLENKLKEHMSDRTEEEVKEHFSYHFGNFLENLFE